jgi:hypothetical protein
MMATTTSPRSQQQSKPLLSSSGRELLLDLKRSTRGQLGGRGTSSSGGSGNSAVVPTLPTYNNKLVQQCLQDLIAAHEDLRCKIAPYDGHTNKPPFPARPAILLQNDCIHRYKRCLLAYHYQRMQIMQDIVRSRPTNDIVTAATAASGDDDNNNNTVSGGGTTISTNAQEVAFAEDYAALREHYAQQVYELNRLPPTSPMLQVRVLKDVGQVVLPDSGRSVTMTRGACLFLDRADVVDFLQQGIVQVYDGEEIDF